MPNNPRIATSSSQFFLVRAINAFRSSLSAHPLLWIALFVFPTVAAVSPSTQRLLYNASIVVATVVVFAYYKAVSDIVNHKREIGRIRDGSSFFRIDSDLYWVAANKGMPARQYPLANVHSWTKILDTRRRENAAVFKPLQYVDNPQIQSHLNQLVEHVSMDFINNWYKLISSDAAVVSRVEYSLHYILNELKTRIEKSDVVHLIVSKVCPLLTMHMRELQKAEYLLRAERVQKNTPEGDEQDYLLARCYNGGKLHPAVSTSATASIELELAHLRKRVQTILPLLLPKNEAGSRLIHTILREVLVCKILQPVVDSFTDSDYWNLLFDSLSETIIQSEQSLGRKFGDLDKMSLGLDDMIGGPNQEAYKPPMFDDFMKQIKTCDTVAEANRLRDLTAAELQTKQKEILGYEPDEIVNGVKVSDISVYIQKLELALRRIDKKMSMLNAKKPGDGHEKLTFQVILEDQSLFPYFSSYLEHHSRSFYLQAWESIYNLFIQIGVENASQLDSVLQSDLVKQWDISIIAEQFCEIYNEAFSDMTPFKIAISQSTLTALQTLNETLAMNDDQVSQDVLLNQGGFKLIQQTQNELFAILQKDDYPEFLKSSHYTRMMSSINGDNFPSLNQSSISQREDDSLSNGERYSNELERASSDDIDVLEDYPARKSRAMGIIESVFKRRKKSPVKQFHTDFQSTLAVDAVSPVAIRLDSNFEGELQDILSNDDNTFSAASNTKSGRKLGSDSLEKEDFSRSRSASPEMMPKHGTFSFVNLRKKDKANSHLSPSETPDRRSIRSTSPMPDQEASQFLSPSVDSSKNRRASNPKLIDETKKLSADRDIVKARRSSAIRRDGSAAHEETDTTGSKDVAEADPDWQYGKGEEDDEMNAPISDHSIQNIPLIPRTRQELIDLFQPDQDILPSMIASPKKVMEINDELVRLRNERDEIEKQTEVAAKRDKESDDGVSMKALRFMSIGVNEELKRLLNEKRKLELDELENIIMPDRCAISIGESQVTTNDGKNFAIYPIQIQRLNIDGVVSGWIVMRRYSEFLTLHQGLKSKFPGIVNMYDMPGKLLNGILKIKRQYLEARRAALERYLQNLTRHVDVCKSTEFRKFVAHPEVIRLLFDVAGELNTKRSFFKNILQTVDSSVDSFKQRLRSNQISGGAQPISSHDFFGQSPSSSGLLGSSPLHQPKPGMIGAAMNPSSFNLNSASQQPYSSSAFSGMADRDLAGATHNSATDAVIDLFIELFELKERNNWLRRNAVVILLQQLFGGTVERKVMESLRWAVGEENVAYVLKYIIVSYWPNGVWGPQYPIRTVEARRRTRLETQNKLSNILPEMIGNVVGRQNAKRGGLKWCATFQNRRLNQHLMYTIADELLNLLFPETK